MEIDLYAKAIQLLEKVANSVYEREAKNVFCFSSREVHLVEDWLKEFMVETQIEKPKGV